MNYTNKFVVAVAQYHGRNIHECRLERFNSTKNIYDLVYGGLIENLTAASMGNLESMSRDTWALSDLSCIIMYANFKGSSEQLKTFVSAPIIGYGHVLFMTERARI